MRADWSGAPAHLTAAEPRLRPIIEQNGLPSIPLGRNRFQVLGESIIHQQLAGPAATTICSRLKALHGGRFPAPERLRRAPDAKLRSAGISPQKTRYLKDLAARVDDGRLDLRHLHRRSDGEVVEEVTQVLGIGEWTAQMFLIFCLGRPDVWPTGDLGVRKGVQRTWGLRSLPDRARMERIGRPLSPHRSAAAWYLWKSLDIDAPGVG
jgi:3-methyladenine DNA glycosylase/8-oxoguanine DNA glycosylase